MTVGRILVSDEDGQYLLKFSGDVRVTLCGSLNRHMEMIFGSQLVTQVVVDMLEAECLDSTTLGLMAKLGLYCRKEYGINMQVFCQNPSILRTLDCMGFEEIFDICQEIPVISAELQDIGAVVNPVDKTREQVLEAHKLLMQLNPDNCKEFTDLISALESGR